MWSKACTAVLILIMVLSCAGCMRWEGYSSDLVKSFKKDIMHDFPEIQTFRVKYSPPMIAFDFKMNSDTSKEKIIQIFKQTRTFFKSEEFQKEFFEVYFTEFKESGSGDLKHYPEVDIAFDTDGDKVANYGYISVYETIVDPAKGNRIINYEVWGLQKQDGSYETVDY